VKNNDIYSWSYNDETLKKKKDGNNGGTTYWCVSNIAIYNKKRKCLIDTYWSTGSKVCFNIKEIKKQLILKYIGNLDKLNPCSKEDFNYYDNKNCINITHSNMSRGGYYLKKNAKRSIKKMKMILKNKIDNLKSDIVFKQNTLKRYEDKLKNLKINDYI
jgi:hypothetical protein